MAALILLAVLLLQRLDISWLAPGRIVLGFLAVLWIPGYTLMVLLFPRRQDADGPERMAISVGLSIAAVSVLSLVLSQTPWGIRPLPMLVALLLWVGLCWAGIAVRRRQLSPGEHFVVSPGQATFRRGAGVLCGAALVVGAVVGVTQALRPPERTSEFYLLGPTGQLGNYPSVLGAGEPFKLRLGVHNLAGQAARFVVHTNFGGPSVRLPALAQGAVWEREVVLRAPGTPGRVALDLVLRQETSPGFERRLRLNMDIVEKP